MGSMHSKSITSFSARGQFYEKSTAEASEGTKEFSFAFLPETHRDLKFSSISKGLWRLLGIFNFLSESLEVR